MNAPREATKPMPHRIFSGLLGALLLLAGVAQAQVSPVQAQQAAPPVQALMPAAGFERVLLTAGRSTVLATEFDITRIAVTNPAMADAVVVQPREILIDGKSAGTVSLIVWGVAGRAQYDVVVEPAVTTLQQKLQALFPGEDITATLNDEAIILSGRVSSTAVMLKAGEIAQASAPKLKVINMLQLPGAQGSQQVMLQVRFAEVNRRAIEELGVNLFMGPNGENDYVARTTTQQFSAPGFDRDTTTFSDFLNLFVMNTKYNIGVVIRALQGKGYFQSLAEPNLIAYNGQQASFLAGGEFPVPVVQGATGAVTVEWKEFGVRLTFTPTIAGDMIRLKVRPEVSSLDFNNGITLQGFRIPSLITRYAETDVELARRAVVCNRRPHEQHRAGRRAEGPDPRKHPDHRLPVQEQGGQEGADRADGAHHAAARAPARSGRGAEPADQFPAVPAVRTRCAGEERNDRRAGRAAGGCAEAGGADQEGRREVGER